MHDPTARTVLVLALAAAGCGPSRSPGVMVETTLRFRVDDARNVTVVEAHGPSVRMKQECVDRIRHAVAAGQDVGGDVGGGVREFVCFDFFPR